MAFFPNYLRKCFQLEKQAELRAPFPEDQIPELKELLSRYKYKPYFFFDPYFFMDGFDLDPTDKIAVDVSYQIATKPKLRETLHWIYKRVLFATLTDNYITVDVCVRIGTSMLNKLVETNCIDKNTNIYIHDNFVKNLADLRCEISVEELPF